MDKIASPNELIAALEDLLDYAHTTKPSRDFLASELSELAERVAARPAPLPREFYLPPEAKEKEAYTPEGTDLAVWTWEFNGVPYAMIFQGKAQKPLWHYRFKSEAARQKEIDNTIESRKKSLEFKNKRLDEKKHFKHSLNVGDILYASWGYDQTNVDFYQVTKLIGDSTVEYREVESKISREERGADYVVAVPNRFVGGAMKGRVGLGNVVKVDNVRRARPWDGKPQYQTPSGMGH